MALARLSSVAGFLLSPLPNVVLDKLYGYLVDYMSSDEHQNDAESLKDCLEEIKRTLRKAKQLRKPDEKVSQLLIQLKYVVYDAQDLQDELEYIELKIRVKEIDPTRRFFSFCKKKFEVPGFKNNLNKIIKRFQNIHSELESAFKMSLVPMILDQPTNYDNLESRDERVTTSTTSQKKIYGRDGERKQLIEMLKKSIAEGNVCVMPILGMGGMGKTALAQNIFNNKEIENHFHYRTWIHVSDNFSRRRITREILEYLKNRQFLQSTNLDNMERKIQQTLRGKRFLLVLDDVWTRGWKVLLNHLESADVECVKIVVTARDSKVLGTQGNLNGLILQGLKDDEYWSFFVKCIFFGEDQDLDSATCSPMLESIGKQITKKLKGSPLAAKTVGRLLSNDKRGAMGLCSQQELGTEEDDIILPALALSYNHLSKDLQRCFAFCSLFPTDHMFTFEEVIYMWIAHGYIPQNQGSSKTAEEIGREYFNKLLSVYFFQPCPDSLCFKFHSLARDFALSVSSGENFTYDADALPIPVEVEVIERVRHLWARGDRFLSTECKTTSLRTHVAHGTEAKLSLRRRRELKNHCSAELKACQSGWFWELEIFRRIPVLVLYNYAVQEFVETN